MLIFDQKIGVIDRDLSCPGVAPLIKIFTEKAIGSYLCIRRILITCPQPGERDTPVAFPAITAAGSADPGG